MKLWNRFDDLLRYVWAIFGVLCLVATAQADYTSGQCSDEKQDAINAQYSADRQKSLTDTAYSNAASIYRQVQQRVIAGTQTALDTQFLQAYQSAQSVYTQAQTVYTEAKNSFNQGSMLFDLPNPIYDVVYGLFYDAVTSWTDADCSWVVAANQFNAAVSLYRK